MEAEARGREVTVRTEGGLPVRIFQPPQEAGERQTSAGQAAGVTPAPVPVPVSVSVLAQTCRTASALGAAAGLVRVLGPGAAEVQKLLRELA